MNYTVLLGEVNEEGINKELLPDIKIFLETALVYLSKIFKKSLKVPPTYQKEEFQGVFTDAVAAYLYYRQLKMLLFPLIIRVGLGEGKHYPNPVDSETIEGPAHYHAERSLALATAYDIGCAYLSFSKSDKYLNSLLQALDFMEKKQSISVNLVKLFSEMYFPLYKKNAMEFTEFQKDKDLIKALHYKEQFYYLLLETNPSLRGTEPAADNFYLPKLDECKIVDLETLYAKEKADIISCFWERGFCTKIAKSMNNTTRQNVNKHLENGIIFQRNLEGSVALFLAEKKNTL